MQGRWQERGRDELRLCLDGISTDKAETQNEDDVEHPGRPAGTGQRPDPRPNALDISPYLMVLRIHRGEAWSGLFILLIVECCPAKTEPVTPAWPGSLAVTQQRVIIPEGVVAMLLCTPATQRSSKSVPGKLRCRHTRSPPSRGRVRTYTGRSLEHRIRPWARRLRYPHLSTGHRCR